MYLKACRQTENIRNKSIRVQIKPKHSKEVHSAQDEVRDGKVLEGPVNSVKLLGLCPKGNGESSKGLCGSDMRQSCKD